MPEWLVKSSLYQYALMIGESILAHVQNPLFWPQFAAIAAVFLLSRWTARPLIRRGLQWLDKRNERVPAFQAVIRALQTLSGPATWLILQWLAISIFRMVEWPHHILVITASLLMAWLLIRLASLLVKNETVADLVTVIAWTVAALNIFGLLSPTMLLLDSWSVSIGQLRVSPLTLLQLGLSLWFGLWLANGLAALIERRMQHTTKMSPAMRVLAGKLSRLGLITGAILIAMSVVGIDLTAFAVFSGALGVGLGFGLQKIFSNLVSGVILLMDRSIKPGDVIAVNGTFGWINHLGARYASVVTRDGIEHLIPNEELITQRVENWSYSNDLVRLRIPIGISYHADPRLAIKLCVEAAEMVPRVQLQPEPRCQLVGFGDNSVDLELRIWIDDPPNGRANVISEVLLQVWDRFHEHGVEIPFPQRDLHVRSVFDRDNLADLLADWRSPANNNQEAGRQS